MIPILGEGEEEEKGMKSLKLFVLASASTFMINTQNKHLDGWMAGDGFEQKKQG